MATINGELVLQGAQSTTRSNSNIAGAITEINAAMTALGGGYQLTTVDLSGFTTFAY